MKILLLHQHFKTPQEGGGLRSYYLSRALANQGLDVVIVTSHNEGHYVRKSVEGMEVHYLPVKYENRFGFFQRIGSFLKFVVGIIVRPRLFHQVDLCYAISAPLTVGLAALWIRFWYKIPYCFEVGDLWPDAPVQLGFINNKLLIRILYGLEKRIYQKATTIVALSGPIKREIEKKSSNKNVGIVPNMSDTDFYLPTSNNEALKKQFGVEGKFVVSYIGTLGFANGLDYFLECARVSQRASLPIHFILCGDGAMAAGLKKSAEALDLQNLTILPFQNREGVKDVLKVTDAAFVCYRNVPILETGSPHKYFDGLASGKLIIVNVGGWMKDEVERYQCGISLDPRQPTDFVRKIAVFLKDQERLQAFQTASRLLAEKMYSRNKLSETFVGLVTKNIPGLRGVNPK